MQENRKVAKVAILMSGAAALCRIGSLGKEVYVAWFFGAGMAIDAYSLVILVPALGGALFLNAVHRAFILQFPSHAEEGESEAESLTNLFLTSLLLASVAVALLASPAIVPALKLIPTMNPQVKEYLQELAIPALWMIVPMTMVSGLSSVLNARQHFSKPQLTHIFPPVCIAIFVFTAGEVWGPKALIWGLLVGTAVQAMVLFWMLGRAGHLPRFQLRGLEDVFGGLWKLALPIVILEVMVQGNTAIDRAMASTLAPGKVSVLYWSLMMKDFISRTLVASLLLVLLPHYSRQVASGETGELRRSYTLVLRYGAIAMFPLSVLLLLCGPVLFQHLKLGKLDQEAARTMAFCLAAYGVSLFAEVASSSFSNALMALRRIKVLLLISVFAYFIPNIVFNLLLIGPLGAVGLAISTSLVSYATLATNYICLRRNPGMDEEKRSLKLAAGCLAAALLMWAVGFGVLKAIQSFADQDFLTDAVAAVLGGASGLLVYTILLLKFPGSADAKLASRIVVDKIRVTLGMS